MPHRPFTFGPKNVGARTLVRGPVPPLQLVAARVHRVLWVARALLLEVGEHRHAQHVRAVVLTRAMDGTSVHEADVPCPAHNLRRLDRLHQFVENGLILVGRAPVPLVCVGVVQRRV